MPKKYYAVKKGRKPGIYSTWPDAQKQVSGYPSAQFKSFQTEREAQEYVNGDLETPSLVTPDSLVAYVDGSFDKRTQTYSYGVVLLKNNKVLAELNNSARDPEYAESFQIAGECFGALNAIKWAIDNSYKDIIIYYDYLGIEMWATGQWKANKTVSKDYVKFFKAFKNKINISFVKVKAHTGVIYNERADELAKQALTTSS
ncbi:ribonuclease HI [Alkalibacterium putridalgicola]|jgi:ribonuclease HI|uniref:Ribonuclease H n=1 Tax=Alkalibacterium putridalgicola TaxID=426703 RepID=A0A1H7TNW1_9LACT|nr:ribonuclease H family protein [Alkalibacterium putridalgicola]GEK88177.1 RNase H [Alkalibacterium putridalgicola]SEL86530.1 ribonuclease HI [Alkalibacterium putridalgicola]